MFNHLTDKDLAGLYALLAIASLPVVLPYVQKIEYLIKTKINNHLAKYGLRLKEHGRKHG